ncbi:MAG: SGNH/GDSL hydrolase family protein [Pseudomonadota bacterium]
MALTDYLLAPIFVPQAIWVASQAARLPEAAGERRGSVGRGPSLSVLVLGDSSAAGVGVTQQAEALGGQLSLILSQRFSVCWQVAAKSGGTVRSTIGKIGTMPDEHLDFVVIALGVNDAKNGVSLKAWTERYNNLLDELQVRFGNPLVCISGLPPVRFFPILPRPLNAVLGRRVEMFDAELRRIASLRQNVAYLPLDFTLDITKMASDGFHPGPDIYAEWAMRAAQLLD